MPIPAAAFRSEELAVR